MDSKIKAIDKQIVHRICSGQVILDLATAVKELVENALDAGASNVEVRLKEYGAESIEVADNGTGIAPTDYHALTLKYHTSKLQAFSDLQELNSFGFRGEALSSLCALSDIHVVTRQASQSAGVRLEFDHKGNLTSTGAAARSTGTTICVKNIFKTLPVRYKEFKRNVKKEYGKMILLLQAYALISTGVRIVCTNQSGNGSRTTVVSTQIAESVRDNIVTVFGPRTADGLDALEATGPNGLRFSGHVSKGAAGMSRATGDRQFLFLNGRPIDLPKANKLINETFRSLASPALAHHKPMFVINIMAPTHSYDVNVTPDKRKVFMEHESQLLASLQEALNEIWEPTRSRYEVNGTQPEAKHRSKRRRTSLEGSSDESEEEAEEEEGKLDPSESGASNAKSSTPTITPAGQNRAREKSSILSALQRSSTQPYRNSPLGDPQRRSSAGTPMLSSFGRLSSHSKQPLISRFTQFGSGQQSGSTRMPESSPYSTAASPAESVPDSAQPTPSTAPPGDTEEDEEMELQGLDAHDLGEDISLTAKPESSPNSDSARPAAAENASQQTAGNDHEDDGLGQEGCDNEALEMGLEEKDTQYKEDKENEHPRPNAQAQDPALDDIDLKPPREHKSILQDSDSPGTGKPAVDEGDEVLDVDSLAEEILTAAPKAQQMTAEISMESLRSAWQKTSKQASPEKVNPAEEGSLQFQAASLQSDNGDASGTDDPDKLSAAALELERVFEKSQFKELQILGQFNLGFILARLGKDLFIIDQHASDEKYNFERLTNTTQLNRQPLLQPRALDLTPSESVIIKDHLDIFFQNGFELEDKDGKLYLKGVPYSQNISFGASDVQELAQLLLDGAFAVDPGRQIQTQSRINVSDRIPRPSRVRSMLAMRACRSSIMIGKTLDMRTMRKILDHLADLDSPWNCPHGRPTMRHLAVLPA